MEESGYLGNAALAFIENRQVESPGFKSQGEIIDNRGDEKMWNMVCKEKGGSWCAGGSAEEEIAHLEEAVRDQGYGAKDFRVFYSSGNKTDMAYEQVKNQFHAMKSAGEVFQYSGGFKKGNLLYGTVKDSGHDQNTVISTFFRCMPMFFGKE